MQTELEDLIEQAAVKPNTVLPIDPNEIGDRAGLRQVSIRGRESYKILYENIVVRPGHNGRTEDNPGFSRESLEELARSIISEGLKHPLEGDFKKNGQFVLTAGERRYRAIGIVRGWIKTGNIKETLAYGKDIPPFDHVECFVNPKNYSEIDRVKAMLIENSGVDLTPMEQAEAMARLIRDGMTAAQITKSIPGMNAMTVSLRLRLADLSPEVKALIKAGRISETAAVQLSKIVPDPAEQVDRINEAPEGKLKIKDLVGDDENELRDKNLDGANKGTSTIYEAPADETGEDDDESPFGGIQNHAEDESYDHVSSGAEDDASMKGTSPHAPSLPTKDPAIKSADQPDDENSERVSSGKSTAFDMVLQCIGLSKAIYDEAGEHRSPKMDTFLYDLDKKLYDLKVILKK